jgi:hypothetical protein
VTDGSREDKLRDFESAVELRDTPPGNPSTRFTV